MKKLLLSLLILSIPASTVLASYFTQGQTYYIRKDYDKAKEAFLAAVLEDPSNGDSYYFLGEIAKLRESYGEAAGYYAKAVRSKSLSSKYQKMAYANLRVLGDQNTDYKAVVRANKNTWEKNGDPGAREIIDGIINKMMWSNNDTAISYYNKGSEYKRGGNISEALSQFKSAIDADDSFLAPKFQTGLIMLKQGNTSGAIANIKKVADKIPFYSDANLIMGKLYLSTKNFDNAVLYYGNALEFGLYDRKEKFNILMERANCYYNMGDIEPAKADLNSASLLFPDEIPVLYLEAAIAAKKNNTDEALSILKKIEQKSPKPELLNQIAIIYQNKKDPKSYDYLEKIFRVRNSIPKDEISGYYKGFISLGEHYYKSNSFEKSAEVLDFVPLQEKTYDQNVKTALSYYNAGKFAKSADVLDRTGPKGDDKILLTRFYVKAGNKDKAKSMIKNLSANPELKQKAGEDPIVKLFIADVEKEEALKKSQQQIQQDMLKSQAPIQKDPSPQPFAPTNTTTEDSKKAPTLQKDPLSEKSIQKEEPSDANKIKSTGTENQKKGLTEDKKIQ